MAKIISLTDLEDNSTRFDEKPDRLPNVDDVRAAARSKGIDEDLAAAIFGQESGGRADIGDSPKGAKGGMQVMPATFKQFHPDGDPENPWDNLEAGLRYIQYGQKKVGNDPRLLAAGYHQGYDRKELQQGRIADTHDGIISTGGYAASVIRRMGVKGLGGNYRAPTPVRDYDAEFNTILTPEEEDAFQEWKLRLAPDDSGKDYDLRGAYKAGITPAGPEAGADEGHWPDTFKKPNHPTFSTQSRYAAQGEPGRWEGKKFVPPQYDDPQDALISMLRRDGLRLRGPTRMQAGSASDRQASGEDKPTGLLDDVKDFGRGLKIGLNTAAADVLELVRRVPGVGENIYEGLSKVDEWMTGKSSDRLYKEDTEAMTRASTPAMQAAMQAKWWDDKEEKFGPAWSNWRSYSSGLAQSIPEQTVMMVPAMRLARGAYIASMGRAVAANAEAGIAGSAANLAAREAAAKASARVATLAGGIGEGALGGAQTSREVRDQIMALSEGDLRDSDALRALMSQGLDFQAARKQLAEDAATKGFFLSGVATGIFGGFGDRVLARAMAGELKGGILKRFGKGMVSEGLFEEFPQSAAQKFSENLVMRDAKPDQDLGEDVLNQALGGLAIGGVQGGAQTVLFGRSPREGTERVRAGTTPADVAARRGIRLDSDTGAVPASDVFGAPVAPAEPVRRGAVTRDDAAAQRVLQPGAAEPRTDRLPPRLELGRATEFATEGGASIKADYALAEAGELVSSHDENLRPDPAYPKELQPRERERAASEVQVSSISQRLNPARLGESSDAATGAPIIGSDGLVESGNARTIALKRVYQAGGEKAEAYKAWLTENAERFGLTAEKVAAMQNPVLVRVRSTPVNRAEFARQANAPTTAVMSPVETARADASRLASLDDVVIGERGEIHAAKNQGFIKRFVAALPLTEQAGLVTATGELSQSGVARIRNAILGKAYGESPALLRMVESMDNNLRNITSALMRVAPAVAKAREDIKAGALHDADITGDLLAAVEELSRIREAGHTVAEVLAQSEMFGMTLGPEAVDLMQFLDANMRHPNKIAAFIEQYLVALGAAGSPAQSSLLGESAAPPKKDIIAAAKARTEGEPTEAVPPGADAEPVAPAAGAPAASGEAQGGVPGAARARASDQEPAGGDRGAEGAGSGVTLRSLLAEFDAGTISSAQELAERAKAIESDEVDAVVATYEAALKEDMEEFGGRGDADTYGEALIAGLEGLAAKEDEGGAKEAAQAEFDDALAELGLFVLDKTAKKFITEEQRRALIPLLTRLFEASAKLGYIKFKEALAHVMASIQKSDRLRELTQWLTEKDFKEAFDAQKPAAQGATGGDQVVAQPYASGMSRPRDMAAATASAVGVGVEIGEVSAAGLEQLADAVAGGKAVFVDSGAFNAFKRSLKSGKRADAVIDFEKILDRYEALSKGVKQRLARSDLVHKANVGYLMLVAPDVVGNQEETLKLLEKHGARMAALADAGHEVIVPFQKGPISQDNAYWRVRKIFGGDHFVVGIPAAVEGLNDQEIRTLLDQPGYTPERIHILGAVAKSRLEPRMKIIREIYKDDVPGVTADAMVLRSKLSQVKGLRGDEKFDRIVEILNGAAPDVFQPLTGDAHAEDRQGKEVRKDGEGAGGKEGGEKAEPTRAGARRGNAAPEVLNAPPKDKPIVLVYGGAFNPPHRMHVTIAKRARAMMEALGYEVAQVVVAPTPDKLLGAKLGADQAIGLADRGEMARLAFKPEDGFIVETGPAEEAEKTEGKIKRTQLAAWVEKKRVAGLATVVNITGADAAPGEPKVAGSGLLYQHAGHGNRFYLAMPRNADDEGKVSSSVVRKAFAAGKSLDDLVGPEVAARYAALMAAKTAGREEEVRSKVEIDELEEAKKKDTAAKYGANDIPLGKNMTEEERAVETRYREWMWNHREEALVLYRQSQGKVINTDEARELSPDYAASNDSRSQLANAVHEPSSWLMKLLYARMLAEPVPSGEKPVVVFTAGGTGSGKSSAIGHVKEARDAVKEANIVLDMNLSDVDGAVSRIEAARKAGREVAIFFVLRDPVESMVKGSLPRAERYGRTVVYQEHAKAHVGSRETILKLAEKYEGEQQVAIAVLDNTRGRGGASWGTLEQVKPLAYNDLREQLRQNLEAERKSGHISERVYRGTLGDESAARPDEEDGRRDAQKPAARAGSAEAEGLLSGEQPPARADVPAARRPEAGDAGGNRKARPGPARDSGQVGFDFAAEAPGTREERAAALAAERAGDNGSGGDLGREGGRTERGRAGQRPAGAVGDRPGPVTGPTDYIITDADTLGAGGAKSKTRGNLAAITLLKKLQAEDRLATPDEQAILVKYVGWGGLKQIFDENNAEWAKERDELKGLVSKEEFERARRSVLDAHYTSKVVVDGIYQALARMGFAGGAAIEPAVGIGHFIGLMPPEMRAYSRFTAVELDPITGEIAKQLYQRSNVIAGKGFEKFDAVEGYFDVAVGNPPFGETKVFDERNRDISKFSLHNFFFAKSVKSLRPGGILGMVVSNFFLDANKSIAREWIAQHADLVGAIRLPNTAFKANAGTEVTTDIIFLQKRAAPISEEKAKDVPWVKVGEMKEEGTGKAIPLNSYFVKNPGMMLGKMTLGGTMYARESSALEPIAGQDLATVLAAAVGKLPRNIYTPGTRSIEDLMNVDSLVPEGVKVGGMFSLPDGQIAVRLDDRMEKTRSQVLGLKEKTKERVRGLIALRDVMNKLMRAEIAGDDKDTVQGHRLELNRAYDAFVKKFGFVNDVANRRAFDRDPDAPRIEALEKDYDPGLSKEVAAREGADQRKPSAKKADIFTKPTQAPREVITKVDNATDALSASLGEKGRIDFDYMAAISGLDQETLKDALGGLVFRNPAGGWETNDKYLSGNVKAKLVAARKAAATDPGYQGNVEALERVQPADIEAVDISARLGSPWIPASDVKDFIKHLLNVDAQVSHAGSLAKWIVQIPRNNSNEMEQVWGAITKDEGGRRHGWDAADIIGAVLNNTPVIVKENHGTAIEPQWVVLEAETRLAQQKADDIRNAFNTAKGAGWLWDDQARRERLARKYNDTFNTNVVRIFDGKHLTLPGTNPAIELTPNKKHAVWRMVQDNNVLLDHVVGSGKTFTIAAGFMELRRLGLMKKGLVVVPNHLVKQWRDEWYALYPNANVLAATEQDFDRDHRQRLFSRIATGDWDAVIVPHSSFVKIGMPEDMQQEVLNEQINDITDAIDELKKSKKGEGFSVRQMEKARERIKERIERLSAGTGRKDQAVNFAELGIDGLAVDEAHLFKNLFYYTQMRGVAGLGDPNGSARAFDLFVKSRYISKLGGRMIFATGTPISNSLVEMFTMQRYMAYADMKARGIHHLDSWAGVYGKIAQVWEIDPSGQGSRLSNRFAKFVNLPELLTSYRSFADVLTMDHLHKQFQERLGKPFPVPKIKGGKPELVIAKRSPAQARFFGVEEDVVDPETSEVRKDDNGRPVKQWNEGSILYRIENMPKDPRIDNMLKVTNDARHAGLDLRTLFPKGGDFAGSKINQAVDRILKLWKAWDGDRGTQLVFLDLSKPSGVKIPHPVIRAPAAAGEVPEDVPSISMDELLAEGSKFSVYDDMRAKLIKAGMPAHEIAFIHEAHTSEQKKKLFAKVNRGEVRVLFGSTAKMGAGTNVQKRLVGLHHIDAPWRPSDLEQRDGRAIRQGNDLYKRDPDGFEMALLRYGTENSYDTRMWQLIEHKARGIQDIRTGNITARETEDVDGEAANAGEMKAAVSGNPLIMDEIKMRAEVQKLEGLEQAYKRQRFSLQAKATQLAEADTRVEKAKERMAPYFAARKPKPKEGFTFTTHEGNQVTTPGTLAGPLTDRIKSTIEAKGDNPFAGQDIYLGQFRGIYLWGHRSPFSDFVDILGTTAKKMDKDTTYMTLTEYGKGMEFSPGGFITRMDNAIDKFEEVVTHAEEKAHLEKLEAKKVAAELEKPWDKASDLERARAEHRRVLAQIDAGGKPAAPAAEVRPPPGGDMKPAASRSLGLRKFMSSGQTTNEAGIPAEQLKAVVDRVTPGVKAVASGGVQIVQLADQLPEHIRNFLLADGSMDTTEGLYDQRTNKVYLIASNIESEERAEFVIFHELFGHYGMRGFFGKKLDGVLADIWIKNANVRREAAALTAKFGYSQTLATEEALANMAGRGETFGGLRQFILAMQRELRAMGFTKLADFLEGLSDAEAMEIVAQARHYAKVEERIHIAPRGVMEAYAFKRYEPKEFSGWFQGSKIVNKDGSAKKVYRGEWGPGAGRNPFQNTSFIANTPTFTDVPDIAQAYATSPNYRAFGDEADRGRVGFYYLAIKNPITLSTDEDVVEIGDLRKKLGDKVSATQFAALLKDIGQRGQWRFDGDPVTDLVDYQASQRERIYTDTFAVANSPVFTELARLAGYDGVTYYGNFTRESAFLRDPKLVEQETSWQDAPFAAWEVRPFSPGQVRAAFAPDKPLRSARERPLAPPKADQVDTPAFKKWFGESKVVEDGKPLVVYHGTSAKPSAIGTFRTPAYFSNSADFAEGFAKQRGFEGTQPVAVYPVFLKIERPYVLDGYRDGSHFEWDAGDVKRMKAEGFDGVIIERNGDDNIYTVFDPEQVKSAIGNRGTFDAESGNIRLSKRDDKALGRENFMESPFIGYITRDGKTELYDQHEAKAADYHHSFLVKDLDAYSDDFSLNFVRMDGKNIYTIKGDAVIEPYEDKKSEQQIARLARVLLDAGADPAAPFKVADLALSKIEAPYQDKQIGTLGAWADKYTGGEILLSKRDELERRIAQTTGWMKGIRGARRTGYKDEIAGLEAELRELLAEHDARTRTPEFREWFKKSKVVGKDGKPLQVYHGTKDDFTGFDMGKAGSHTDADSAKHAIFFTDNPKVAEGYTIISPLSGVSERENELLNEAAQSIRVGGRTVAELQKENEEKVGELFDGGAYIGQGKWRSPEDKAKAKVLDVESNKLMALLTQGAGHRQIIPVYLSMQNPLRYDMEPFAPLFGVGDTRYDSVVARVLRDAKRMGRDGVIFKNILENLRTRTPATTYAIFKPEQAKSVFNVKPSSSPDILKSQRSTPAQDAEAKMTAHTATFRPLEMLTKGAVQLVRLDRATAWAYDKTLQLVGALIPEKVKAGVVADYGIPEAVTDRRVGMQGAVRKHMREVERVLEALAGLTRAESRVAYEWMNADTPEAADYFRAQLPAESIAVLADVEKMVEAMSREAIRLGQLSAEVYERNKFAYLRRSYVKHTAELTPQEHARRSRAIAVFGDQYKGRGISDAVDMAKVKNIAPEFWKRKLQEGKADKGLVGEEFIRLERRAPDRGPVLPGMPAGNAPRRLLEVAYWPAGEPVPTRYATWDRAGPAWEVRDVKGGKLILWRDFAKQEREAMGEIDEVKYGVARTLSGMIHDVEVGRYLEWLANTQAKPTKETLPAGAVVIEARESLLHSFAPGEWVKVPDTEIPGTATARYGKLAGLYLPGPIWNDVRQTVNQNLQPLGEYYAAILRAWKISKTALSPAVHMNNVMANVVMADWHDVGAAHIGKALGILINQGEPENKIIVDRFDDAGGSIGTFSVSELQREQLKPLLDQLRRDMGADSGMLAAGSAIQLALAGKMREAMEAVAAGKVARTVSSGAEAMIDLYQSEDVVFRLAVFLRAKEQGATDQAAGKLARKSFLDYHINAPWIQMMRSTAFPFISFTYRAVPMLAETAARKPWKLLKLAMLAGAANALGYALSGGDEDRERKRLPEEKAGRVWGFMVPKLIRMPWNDRQGSPVFLDIRRWIPVGDVFDLGQTHSAIPILPVTVPGGPLAVLAEVLFNKSQFTGREITKDTDKPGEKAAKTFKHLWQALVPNMLGIPGTYATGGVVDAATGKTDAFGRELSAMQAVLSSVGIKIAAYPEDVAEKNLRSKRDHELREIGDNEADLRRQYQRKSIGDKVFADRMREQAEKRQQIHREFQEKLKAPPAPVKKSEAEEFQPVARGVPSGTLGGGSR